MSRLVLREDMSGLRVPLFAGVVRWGGVLAIAAVVCYFSLFDAVSAPPDATPWWDKRIHLTGYAALSLATAYATVGWRDGSVRRALAVPAAVVGYGVLIELAQAPLDGRYASLGDVIANAVGALIALVWYRIERRVSYRQPFRDR